jgi:cytochrome c oxidase cbb3-type subunit 3
MSADKSDYKPDTVLDHDYDGIQEFDNRLPNWWLWILWGTIVFSVAYWLVFHTYGIAKDPIARFEASMESAGGMLADSETRGLTDSDLVALSSNTETLRLGRDVYTQHCLVCHKEQGEGLVGPNLTDDYWIHGGSPLDIHNTVVRGVPEKGMAVWGRQLSPDQIDSVVALLLTFRGTNVPGKAPEGDLWVMESDVETEPSEAATEETAVEG